MIFKRRYGSTDKVYFYMWATDGSALQTGADLDAGDLKISKDGGAFANAAGTFAEEGNGWYSYAPTTAETQCKCALFSFIDADVAVLDKPFMIETTGHPSAQYPEEGLPINGGVLSGTHTTTSAQFSSATKPAQMSNGTLVWNITTGESRFSTAYNPTTGVVSWDSGLPLGSAWSDDDIVYPLPGAPSPGVNVVSVSGDATAADNLESAFDGTGYDIAGIDVSKLVQVVLDLENGGRLDVILDAIKAVTDAIPNGGALTTIANNVSAILTDTGTTLDTKINTIDGNIDAIKAITDALPDSGALTTIDTNIDTALTNLATLAAALTVVDSVADAIKAKTDQLVFGVTNQLNTNMKSINGTGIIGNGSSSDKFRVA